MVQQGGWGGEGLGDIVAIVGEGLMIQMMWMPAIWDYLSISKGATSYICVTEMWGWQQWIWKM